jgi:hypothetical protein
MVMNGIFCAEDEVDDLALSVTRYKPEELDKLAKNTLFTRKEIQLIYRGFKQVRMNYLFNSMAIQRYAIADI